MNDIIKWAVALHPPKRWTNQHVRLFQDGTVEVWALHTSQWEGDTYPYGMIATYGSVGELGAAWLQAGEPSAGAANG